MTTRDPDRCILEWGLYTIRMREAIIGDRNMFISKRLLQCLTSAIHGCASFGQTLPWPQPPSLRKRSPANPDKKISIMSAKRHIRAHWMTRRTLHVSLSAPY